jgi:hypothetical protein
MIILVLALVVAIHPPMIMFAIIVKLAYVRLECSVDKKKEV